MIIWQIYDLIWIGIISKNYVIQNLYPKTYENVWICAIETMSIISNKCSSLNNQNIAWYHKNMWNNAEFSAFCYSLLASNWYLNHYPDHSVDINYLNPCIQYFYLLLSNIFVDCNCYHWTSLYYGYQCRHNDIDADIMIKCDVITIYVLYSYVLI